MTPGTWKLWKKGKQTFFLIEPYFFLSTEIETEIESMGTEL